MTPEQWRRLKPLFDEAMSLPPEARGAFVERVGSEDLALAGNLAELIRDDRAGALDKPLFDLHGELGTTVPQAGKRTVASAQVGQIIAGRFRILRQVGEGGMGEVFEAEDLQLQDRVALKTIRPSVSAVPRVADRFKREILLGKRIAHPNVCRIHDLGSETGPGGEEILFLTMEFLDGETLSARIKQGPMDEAEALPLVQNMADGLAAAHEAGIVHRDFKSANVMLVRTAGRTRAVITDFGLARPSRESEGQEEITKPGAIAGTVGYMAPEQIRGEPVTPAADLYALGVVMYQMATGRMPFQGSTDAVIASKHLQEAPPSPASFAPGISKNWENAILACLRKAPEKRPASALELKALVGATQSQVSVANQAAVPVPGVKFWLAAVGLAVLATLAFFAAQQFSRPRIPPRALELTATAVDRLANNSFLDASKVLEQVILEAPHYAVAHAMLADAENELDLTGRANREMNRISAADLRGATSEERAYIEGVRLTLTRDYGGAAEQFRRYFESGDEAARPNRAIILGRALEKAQKPAEAMKAYASAGKRGGAFLSLAVLDSRQQQVQKALAEFEEARKQFEALGEHGAMAGLQYQLGAAYNRWGRLPEAEAADRTCMEQAGVVGDGYDLLRCRQQLATIALQRAHTDEDYAAVRGDLTGIIEDAGHQGFQILQARAWLSASQVDAMRNRFTDAERSLNEALARAEGEESARVKALINLARADLFLRTKRPEPAEKDAEAAAVFFREDGTLKELAQALLLKGRALQEQFRFEDALKEFQAEQAVAAKVSPGNEAQAIEASGTVYQYQENYPAAANRFRRALELGGSTAGAAYYRLELARALIELGRWEEAKAALAPLDGAKLLPGLRQRLSLERASMQLFSGGTRSIRNELKGTAPDDPEVLLLEGQADLLARSFRSAREKCGLALANESAAQERHFAAVSSICAAEAALGAGAAQESLDLLASHEAVWAAFPVQRLRGLVLRSEALKAIGRNEEWKAPLEGAVSVVSGLIALWGPGDFQSFQNRADVRGNPVLLNFIHGESK